MIELTLDEASGVVALLLDGMANQRAVDLGEEAVLGLNVVLRSVKGSMDKGVEKIDKINTQIAK